MPAVRRSLTVGVDRQTAFTLFTDGFGMWWPPSHHVAPGDLDTVIIEPRANGRWYEKLLGGGEANWGTVIAIEPPSRLLLGWQLNHEWQYDRKVERASTIEITFSSVAAELTQIDFEHRDLANHGREAQAIHDAVNAPEGWTFLLSHYTEFLGA